MSLNLKFLNFFWEIKLILFVLNISLIFCYPCDSFIQPQLVVFPWIRLLAYISYIFPQSHWTKYFELPFIVPINLSTVKCPNLWPDKSFKKRQCHDKEKNKYCFDNNITLIRIPYTHYNNLYLDDLLENSQFIIKKEVI